MTVSSGATDNSQSLMLLCSTLSQSCRDETSTDTPLLTCRDAPAGTAMGSLSRYDPGYDAATSLIQSGELNRWRDCHSAAHPSTFSRCFNRD